MARRASSRSSKSGGVEPIPDVDLIPDEEHHDYVAGTVTDGTESLASFDELDEVTPVPGGPIPPFPLPRPIPPIPPVPQPQPLPFPIPRPFPRPIPPINFCGAVSGRYRYVSRTVTGPTLPAPSPAPSPIPGPVFPIDLLTIKVRVDVDRYFPQNRISIEVRRLFPNSTAHAIAEVTSDTCLGFNNRRIEANITYRDGDASLIPGDRMVFNARRTSGINYNSYTLNLIGPGSTTRTYNLVFESRYFDPVEFEVDRVANAGTAVTTYATGSHPNRPATLPNETISLRTVYQRAGFDVTMSPNTTVIPVSGAGANGTWSDSEMHNAMVTYWSRFQNRPQWAMWVLYAEQHDQGRSLGGVMFDDIGPNHRQGTAIFTDSFIQDVPAGDPNPAAWRLRMTFWTAVHEMGHAFNLAHAWQKALGAPQAPGDPWVPLANAPESRSFMNYPFRVSGGPASFFSDFRFRFTDEELVFMRHAPRRFVQMGNSNWFVNHGFEAPDAVMGSGSWRLEIRPNRETNSYRFLEPVNLELKLTNTSRDRVEVDVDMLADGRHITVFVQREGGETRKWRAMVTRCHEENSDTLKQGQSIYGAHLISASTEGWIIDESGFYKVQAAVDMGGGIVVSNVLRLYVAPPSSADESLVAPDYFSEDVGRAIVFAGAPALSKAHDVLKSVTKLCADNPAARHTAIALSAPMLRNYKILEAGEDRVSLTISTQAAKVDKGAKAQMAALMDAPDIAAETLGHIGYFSMLGQLAEAMEGAGDDKGADKVLKSSIATMKKRNILASVIQSAERKLARRK